MKEIGEKLKEARESIGVSIDEVATDLKVSLKQLEALESGNMDAFKDVINVKYFIRDYAKYLGLDKEDMVDEFNEYLFDYTSKISLDDIKSAKKKEKEDKVKSPYTMIKERNKCNFTILALCALALLGIIMVVVYVVDTTINSNNNVIAYVERTK